MSPRGVRAAGARAALLGLLLGASPVGLGCAARAPRPVERVTPQGVQATAYVSPYQYEHYLRGEIALASGQPAAAAREFADARTGSADDAFLRGRHAQALCDAGDWERAERVLDDSLRRFPNALALHLAQAHCASSQGRDDAALAALQRAAQAAPGSSAPPLEQAALLSRLGRDGDARAVLDAFLARVPDARAFSARLELALRRADLDAALRLVTLSGRRGPRDSAALQRVAALALAQQRPEVAVRVLELLPDGRDARVLRVSALADSGRYSEAEAQLALLRDEDVGGLEGRAELYLRVRRPDIALELLGTAAARPVDATPRQALILGTCLVRLGRPSEAALWLAHVPTDASQAPAARAELTRALRLAGLPLLAAELQARRVEAPRPATE